jgi:hypothetical protein
MSSNIEDLEVIDKDNFKGTEDNKDTGNKTELDTDLYYHYVVLAKKLFPDTDLHLIEYSIACHLIYDIRGEKKPDENTPEFIRANERINQLILDTRKLAEESNKTTEVEKEQKEE